MQYKLELMQYKSAQQEKKNSDKIDHIINTNSHNVNTNSNNINITVNMPVTFGSENLNPLQFDIIQKIINDLPNGLTYDAIKLVYFNREYPENNIVKSIYEKHKNVLYHVGNNNWQKATKDFIADKMLNSIFTGIRSQIKKTKDKSEDDIGLTLAFIDNSIDDIKDRNLANKIKDSITKNLPQFYKELKYESKQ